MPLYNVNAPNGKVYKFSGPPGLTHAQQKARVLQMDPNAGNPIPVSTVRADRAAAAPTPAPASASTSAPSQPPQQNFMQRLADDFHSFGSGVAQWIPFNAVNRLVAEGAALTGHGTYGQNLQHMNAMQMAAKKAHPYLYGAGAVGGAVGGGAGLVKGVGAIGSALSKAPGILGAAGEGLSGLTTLKEGQTAANAAKLAAGSGAYGATDRALEGGSPGQIAESAAISAPLGPLGAKVADVAGSVIGSLFRPVGEYLTKSQFGHALRTFTTATKEEIDAAMKDYSTATSGTSKKTLFEYLPQADQDRIAQYLLGQKSGAGETARSVAAPLIRARAGNVRSEMKALAEKATAPQQTPVVNSLASDLANSRNSAIVQDLAQGNPVATSATPSPQELALAREAANSPTALTKLKSQESHNIMASHDNQVVAGSVDPLMESNPILIAPGVVSRQEIDPAVRNAIISVAGPLKVTRQPITVRGLTGMIREASSVADNPVTDPNVRATYQAAADHLEQKLAELNPEAANAYSYMKMQRAGKERMREGVTQGLTGRNELTPAQLNASGGLRKSTNIYETPEGQSGLNLGQIQAVKSAFHQTPEIANAETSKLANNLTTQDVLAKNVGNRAAAKIVRGATAQESGLGALSRLRSKLENGGEPDVASAAGNIALALNAGSFPLTRANAVMRLWRGIAMRKSTAEGLANMLFSGDEAQVAKALGLLSNSGRAGREELLNWGKAITAANAGPAATTPLGNTPAPSPAPAPASAPLGNTSAPAPSKKPAMPQAEPSPYSHVLQKVWNSEDPAFLRLLTRQWQRESSHGQTDSNGNPITSPAGAIGAAQVMPATAPEAARFAGIPWNEDAYKHDATYNRILGAAYMAKMLIKYRGNVRRALAAYNDGPSNVDAAIKKADGGDWLAQLPKETRDYVEALQ